MIESIQYISQDSNGLSHVDNIHLACKAGVKWVQLRIKDCSDEEYLHQALAAKLICVRYGAKLLLNDRVHLVQAVAADGVHVGLKDTPVKEVRRLLGGECIIGATANTLNDCLNHIKNGADYIGLGPLRFTATKLNLSPVLGHEGFRTILQELRNQNINLPVIAVGGVVGNDLPPLLELGVHGVAVSSSINQAENKSQLVKQLYDYIELNKTGVLC